jgi:hypothetical protein
MGLEPTTPCLQNRIVRSFYVLFRVAVCAEGSRNPAQTSRSAGVQRSAGVLPDASQSGIGHHRIYHVVPRNWLRRWQRFGHFQGDANGVSGVGTQAVVLPHEPAARPSVSAVDRRPKRPPAVPGAYTHHNLRALQQAHRIGLHERFNREEEEVSARSAGKGHSAAVQMCRQLTAQSFCSGWPPLVFLRSSMTLATFAATSLILCTEHVLYPRAAWEAQPVWVPCVANA